MVDGYERFDSGLIKQINPKEYVYDNKYVEDRYDSYGLECAMMSHLRLGYIMGSLKSSPIKSVLDVGYGNGSFLNTCKEAGMDTYGTDISNYELKYGEFVKFEDVFNKYFDLITFFDSLEHFHDISFLSRLNCRYICISVPYCHYNDIYYENGMVADKYFKEWKHRRPNEHIWHFDEYALIDVMKENGFRKISESTIEDIIRKPTDGKPNILTMTFVRV